MRVAGILLLAALPILAQNTERFGTVSFANSCSADVQAPLNRAIALLHDFWYDEATIQFGKVAQSDPHCAIAHWGAGMSLYHQIWNRPSEKTVALGLAEMKKAQSLHAKTPREQEYIAALSGFYKHGKQDYQIRVEAYSAAMAKLYSDYPDDVDAGAFYALSLLAAGAPDDTTLSAQRKAMAVLMPLVVKFPDNPGVIHYIIHACDNPALAQQGLAAAQHYGDIAPSAPHSAHMPGHIFSRLGMWQLDIDANVISVQASERAEANHQSGAMDQFHSYDFLLYAYLQSGQDANAKDVLRKMTALLAHVEAMPDMRASNRMEGMLPYYRTKLPVFYSLEMRDWKAAAALEPAKDALPESQTLTYWARIIADGHLHNPQAAHANLIQYDALIDKLRKSKKGFLADATGTRIEHGELLAWTAFAEGNTESAVKQMREAADLQDKVGQGEVDIPAREMLADMLMDMHQPQQALAEYDLSLKMSPNRFNGLFNAGQAAEAAGEKTRAAQYYSTLLKSTGNGSQSQRPELAHVKTFASSTQVAAN